jgi:hypothetical protein
VRCPWLLAQTKVATILGIFPLFFFSFLLVVTTVIQNHRRGCRIVSNFCMGTSKKIIKIWVKKII